MVDAITSTYTLSCPQRGEARVRLSSFRAIERLPGAAHPAIFRVRFRCVCGDDHVGLIGHDDLDWGLLGLSPGRSFVNLQTDRSDDVATELVELALRRIERGEWPWSFFCFLEDRPRPVTPSCFCAVVPGGRSIGVAVRCPVCGSTSVNLVSEAHVDVPFWNDASVAVVDHAFPADVARTLESFRQELASATFDVKRLSLED